MPNSAQKVRPNNSQSDKQQNVSFQVMSALRRYLENTGETERAAALKIGANRHTLYRWLSDEQSPKKKRKDGVSRLLSEAGGLFVNL